MVNRQLTRPQAEARGRAIDKLADRDSEPIAVGFDGSRSSVGTELVACRLDGRCLHLVPIPARPVELLGHQLQRAAAENA